ncbi:Signal-transduction histidine kinase senX3 [Rubripirellula tenax]|uniref:histidine kinase n=1 Tax=Rubripirellula tenax TaxID=2528015 RepID=A0A5C6FEY9_9BACT|nr:HAMP domain-containing sensor histidine kinase [Rubripirellula tenax]TWU59312.1 Signal-transduction histidine kinase senX3 [Rubripirellula tenax]
MTNNDRLAWPILLLLLTVLVPSAGVVWMMREAVRNERLASNQRLRDAYQIQLQSATQKVRQGWADELGRSAAIVDTKPPSVAFETIVASGNVDGALIRDDEGRLVYPESSRAGNKTINIVAPLWSKASRLEFVEKRFDEASKAYQQLTQTTSDPILLAQIQQALVRCLLKLNRRDDAIELLENQRASGGLVDRDGRLFAAAAEFRLLELLDSQSTDWAEVRDSLVQRLGNYKDVTMTSSQRRFLMTEVQHLAGGTIQWPTRAAETLSSELITVDGGSSFQSRLQPTKLPDVWARATTDGRAIELYRTASVQKRLLELADGVPLPEGISFSASPPGDRTDHLMNADLGDELDGWRLSLSMTDDAVFDDVSKHRRAIHLWIASLVIAVTCVLAWMLSLALRRHMRLAQLKNDLVATVSHELKTPLASTRLLVDTLLSVEPRDPHDPSAVQTREYLQMISQENSRLTRMIDNFLTFSKMDRGQSTANFRSVAINEVATQAVSIFREHTGIDDAALTVSESPNAFVWGDLDSLVTAMVNLLENAWKYSEEPRRISLNIEADQLHIQLAVRDNGIGMNANQVGRAFDRFYQADQRVARTHGGCGLGLSIVRAIAESHAGSVDIESVSNVGSCFTLCLPKLNVGTE